MATISVEEKNYVRMSLLLTGISPRAVRTKFDYEFAPTCLGASLKKEYNKLLDLKKKRFINESQWNLLFPRYPGVPDSKTFDVTLMIALLRNLGSIAPPPCGFDHLPSQKETTTASDLARIKHYRNYLAHLDIAKVDITTFEYAWNDVTSAIGRLGGMKMKQECDEMKIKPLDPANHEIMRDVKSSNDEIRMLKESFEKLKEEMKEMKTSMMDNVPKNVRVKMTKRLKDWKENDDTMFVNTKAAKFVLQRIQNNNCVTIIGNSGVGKTATLRHAALYLAQEKYDVIVPKEPKDILTYHNPDKKQLFVVDDLCGIFSVDQRYMQDWEADMKDIKEILTKKQTKILAACRLQVYLDDKFANLSIFKSCVCNMLSNEICLSKLEKDSLAKLYLKSEASSIVEYYDLYECFPLLCKLYHDNTSLNITDFFQGPFVVFEAEIDNLLKQEHKLQYCALALLVMFNNRLGNELFTEEIKDDTKNIIENTCEACRLDRGTSRFTLRDNLNLLTDTFIKKEQDIYKTKHDKIFDFLASYFGQKMVGCLIRNADIGLFKNRFVLERKGEIDKFITTIPNEYHTIYINRMINDWSKGKLQDVFSNINMKIPQFREKFLNYLNKLDASYQRQLANTCDKSIRHRFAKVYVSYTPLLHCCYIGDISLVDWCCKHSVHINRWTYYRKPPIIIAIKQSHKEMVKMLLDAGADCNKCSLKGRSTLIYACKHGHIEIVNLLLQRGADCHACDRYGDSPILIASANGNSDIVKMLLDKNVDCNKCNRHGESPILKASAYGYSDIVKMLLEKGADCNTRDESGESPVTVAFNHHHTNVVSILFDEKSFERSFIVDKLVREACELGYTDIVKVLLDRGIDCNKLYNGESLVMKACKLGHVEIVKLLLDRRTEIIRSDRYGSSYLMQVCKYGCTELLNMLLDIGEDFNKCGDDAKLNVKNDNEHGQTKIIKILLDRGTDCNTRNQYGASPVMMACRHGNAEIVKMLLDKGADFNTCDHYGDTPLMKACEHGQIEILQMFLDKGADYGKRNREGQLPVMKACEHGQIEVLTMLFKNGADYNVRDWYGKSLVMIASEHHRSQAVNLLLNIGADYNKCDGFGMSPLMQACEDGETEILKMLLDRRADCNTVDINGDTPVMKACKSGHKEVVKMLLDKGADSNKCNKKGQSPISVAFKHGHTDTVKMLSKS